MLTMRFFFIIFVAVQTSYKVRTSRRIFEYKYWIEYLTCLDGTLVSTL